MDKVYEAIAAIVLGIILSAESIVAMWESFSR